jgi:hypothetical protein
LFPMFLTLTVDDKSSGGKAELEKTASKKEILTLKEFSKELEKKTAELTADKKLSGEEEEMAEYFYELVKNSEEKAKQAFENKYGKAELNALLADSNQEQQPKKSY